MIDKKTWVIYLFCVAILLCLFIPLNIPHYYPLMIRGKPSVATIVNVDSPPAVHMGPCHAYYQYKTEEGSEENAIIYGNGACLAPVGLQRPIFYDPEHPGSIFIATSQATPKDAFINELLTDLIISFVVPGIFIAIDIRSKQKKN